MWLSPGLLDAAACILTSAVLPRWCLSGGDRGWAIHWNAASIYTSSKNKWQVKAKGALGLRAQVKTQQHTVRSLLSIAMQMLYRKLKVRHWNCGGRVRIVDGGERGVDSRLPLHLPCPHSAVHQHISWWNSSWQKGTSQKGGETKKEKKTNKKKRTGGPRMALNVWKSTLPIPAIKPKQHEAQTHESERDRIVEFSMVDSASDQTNA